MKMTGYYGMQWSRWLLVFPVVCNLLVGCSALNIGKSEYGCPGMPNGVQCWSARKVYEATHHGQRPQSVQVASPRRLASSTIAPSEAIRPDSDVSATASVQEKVSVPIASSLIGPPPLRTPSRVMRIWIAPWVDEGGDLMWPSFVYTEIEARRWQVGQPAIKPTPILRLLAPTKPLVQPKTHLNHS